MYGASQKGPEKSQLSCTPEQKSLRHINKQPLSACLVQILGKNYLVAVTKINYCKCVITCA